MKQATRKNGKVKSGCEEELVQNSRCVFFLSPVSRDISLVA